jgi:hypothetical protein
LLLIALDLPFRGGECNAPAFDAKAQPLLKRAIDIGLRLMRITKPSSPATSIVMRASTAAVEACAAFGFAS